MSRILVSLMVSGFMVTANAQQADLTDSPGLKRFNLESELGSYSASDIRGVRVGDNVLPETIALQAQGGVVQHISGANRSRKLTVVFAQPYQDSRLLQNLSLEFDKDKGFVTSVTLNYKIDSIYLDILPVYERVVEQALKKYGEPLTMEQVRRISGQSEGDVRLQTFIDGVETDASLADEIKEYLADKIVTRKTGFEPSEQDHALLITGFRQCYFWPSDGYAEWVSLCAFRPNSGNMKGQGIELKLVNFKVQQGIRRYNQDDALSDITF